MSGRCILVQSPISTSTSTRVLSLRAFGFVTLTTKSQPFEKAVYYRQLKRVIVPSVSTSIHVDQTSLHVEFLSPRVLHANQTSITRARIATSDDEHANDTDSVARHGLNELGLYLIRPTCARDMTICEFWSNYYLCGKSVRGSIPGFMGFSWKERFSPAEACLASIGTGAGELFFLRLLLLHYETESLEEIRGGYMKQT